MIICILILESKMKNKQVSIELQLTDAERKWRYYSELMGNFIWKRNQNECHWKLAD